MEKVVILEVVNQFCDTASSAVQLCAFTRDDCNCGRTHGKYSHSLYLG